MRFSIIHLATLMITLIALSARAGVEIGGSRVVYDGKYKQAAISVNNPDDRPYLIQAWVNKSVDSDDNDETFIATPPLFRLEAHSQNSIRIVYTGKKLPVDRESVFWLNIKTIPSSSEDAANQLLITVKNKMKLFYRPAGLNGNAGSAPQNLQFRQRNGRLYVYNPTPFYISFYDLKVGQHELEKPPMAAPLQEVEINQPAQRGATIRWRAINDFGGISEEQRVKI